MILEIGDARQKTVIEITPEGGKRIIRLGDEEISFDWRRIAENHYSLILDHTVWDLRVDLKNETCTVTSHAGVFSYRITGSRHTGTRPKMEEGAPGLQRVRAEMPGKIIRVLVREGETVAYDQSLLILEAMKMQNDIRAPKAGVVKEIAAVAGTAVAAGEFLLSIES